MKRKIRFLLLVALITVCPMLLAACNEPAATHERDISGGFSDIRFDVCDTHVRVLAAEGGRTYIEGAIRKGRVLTTEVKGGVLSVTVKDNRAWWQKLFSRTSALTLYLGGCEYGALSIDGGTGDAVIGEGLSFGDISIDISTGDVLLSAEAARSLAAKTSTGDVAISGVTVLGELYVKNSTGKAELTGVTASSVTVEGSTGDATLTDVAAMGAVSIKRSTGDVVVTRAAAASLTAEANTGSMSFTDLATVGALTVTTTTGRQTYTAVKAASLTAEADTGGITLSNATVTGEASLTTSTGDITLSGAVAGGAVLIRASTGDVTLERADAAELDIETSTGHVGGTLLSEKVFIARSDTGRIDVPETTTGGRCKVVTDTGRIQLSIVE